MSPKRFTAAHWAICVLRAITWVFAASLLAKISSHLLEKNMHVLNSAHARGSSRQQRYEWVPVALQAVVVKIYDVVELPHSCKIE